MNKRLRLPIGIQSFAKLREAGCYYVDKTPYIARLVESGGYYFLSRPRRFGKSLFLDTLACAFEGRREWFENLYLFEHWDWQKRYPVIRINFTEAKPTDTPSLEHAMHVELERNAERMGLTLVPRSEGVAVRLHDLIDEAAEKYGQRAVVLVDEYDKPILDNLSAPDIAREMREGLKNLYSVLKGQDAQLKFVFLTGVSKFSKVSIFSGLNNLRDITLTREYAAICGYTERDVETVFAPELTGLDREEIRRWYNGYQWLGEGVYNPFDLLLLFQEREFRNYWFETGTPTFLGEWLKARGYFTPALEQTLADDELLSAFDVDLIRPEAMLWQSGYLTIKQQQITPAGPLYTLSLPNHEVRTALNRSLQRAWLPQSANTMSELLELYRWLAQGDAAALRAHFERLFASIPHDWYRSNPIAQYEGYYASVFYSHLAALGLELIAEDVSNHGQCDLTIRHGGKTWLVEFKLIEGSEPSGEALAQLKAKDYAAKYRAPGVELIELGIEFSKQKRQIVGWQVA